MPLRDAVPRCPPPHPRGWTGRPVRLSFASWARKSAPGFVAGRTLGLGLEGKPSFFPSFILLRGKAERVVPPQAAFSFQFPKRITRTACTWKAPASWICLQCNAVPARLFGRTSSGAAAPRRRGGGGACKGASGPSCRLLLAALSRAQAEKQLLRRSRGRGEPEAVGVGGFWLPLLTLIRRQARPLLRPGRARGLSGGPRALSSRHFCMSAPFPRP